MLGVSLLSTAANSHAKHLSVLSCPKFDDEDTGWLYIFLEG